MGQIKDDFLANNFTAPFGLGVTARQRPGYSTVDKFGLNPVIDPATDPEDITEIGGVYTYDDFGTAPIESVISSSASDVGVVVEVLGLDIEGFEVSQEITLNGTARVALGTNLWRVYRVEVQGSQAAAGTIYCYTGTGAGVPAIELQRAIVAPGNQQTQMAIYTIPRGKVGFLYRGEFGIQWTGGPASSNEYATCNYQSRRLGSIFKVKKTITLLSSGNSVYIDKRSFPDIIPSLTDIKLVCQEVSATMGINAAFDILLVDEEKLDHDFLKAIGQYGV